MINLEFVLWIQNCSISVRCVLGFRCCFLWIAVVKCKLSIWVSWVCLLSLLLLVSSCFVKQAKRALVLALRMVISEMLTEPCPWHLHCGIYCPLARFISKFTPWLTEFVLHNNLRLYIYSDVCNILWKHCIYNMVIAQYSGHGHLLAGILKSFLVYMRQPILCQIWLLDGVISLSFLSIVVSMLWFIWSMIYRGRL